VTAGASGIVPQAVTLQAVEPQAARQQKRALPEQSLASMDLATPPATASATDTLVASLRLPDAPQVEVSKSIHQARMNAPDKTSEPSVMAPFLAQVAVSVPAVALPKKITSEQRDPKSSDGTPAATSTPSDLSVAQVLAQAEQAVMPSPRYAEDANDIRTSGEVPQVLPTPNTLMLSEQSRMRDPLSPARLSSEPPASSIADSMATTRTTGPDPSTTTPFILSGNQATAGSTPVATPLPNPLERSIARQIAQQVAAATTATGSARKPVGDASLIIRLTPPELGTVRIELSLRDGQLTVRMHADDPAVRQALERMLPALRADLRVADSVVQQITVEPSPRERGGEERGSGHQSQQQQSQQQQQQQDQQSAERQRSFLGSDSDSRRGSERPVFSVAGMPTREAVKAPAPHSPARSAGRWSESGVDALA